MPQTSIFVGNKTLLPADRYESQLPDLVGRGDIMKKVLAAWWTAGSPRPVWPLLVGEPGVGKNHIVYQLAKDRQADLYIIQGHEDITAEDLACSLRISDDPRNKFEYVASPLVTAMHEGGICFIDEIGKIRPRALALLSGVLDDRRSLYSTTLGATVTASPNFLFIAATNTAEISGNAIPEFISSRLRLQIRVRNPDREEISDIVQKHCTSFTAQLGQLSDLLELFWEKLWPTGREEPTVREVLQMIGLALAFAQDEGASVVGETHLRTAFEALFRGEVGGTP